MKRIGILGLLLMSLMLTCCTARADGGDAYAVVHNPDAADRLNLRAAPNKKAESLGKYYNGVGVQILEELNNGWVRVRIGNRGVAEGYMMKAYLQCDNTQAVAAAMPTYTSTSSAWELYQSRDVNGAYDMQGYGETVVLLSHKKADSYIHIDVEFGEGEGKIPVDSIAKRAEAYKPKEKVTYKMIKEYIEAKYGFKVHTAYIAEVKRNLGLPMYDAPNAVEELKQPRKHPTPEKVEAIKDALRYFAVI